MKLKTIKKKVKKNGVKLFWLILLIVTIVTTVGGSVIAAIYSLSSQ